MIKILGLKIVTNSGHLWGKNSHDLYDTESLHCWLQLQLIVVKYLLI